VWGEIAGHYDELGQDVPMEIEAEYHIFLEEVK
jgi:hypothetical protein